MCARLHWSIWERNASTPRFTINKHMVDCSTAQLSCDVWEWFCTLQLHIQNQGYAGMARARERAVYVGRPCDGRYLDSAWSSLGFIYPRPLDLGPDLPQFVRLQGATQGNSSHSTLAPISSCLFPSSNWTNWVSSWSLVSPLHATMIWISFPTHLCPCSHSM